MSRCATVLRVRLCKLSEWTSCLCKGRSAHASRNFLLFSGEPESGFEIEGIGECRVTAEWLVR